MVVFKFPMRGRFTERYLDYLGLGIRNGRAGRLRFSNRVPTDYKTRQQHCGDAPQCSIPFDGGKKSTSDEHYPQQVTEGELKG